jgi:predicted amino acid-binding ACT domain protein
MATAATNIMGVCDAISEELKAAGFFAEGGSDDARLAMVEPAVAAASKRLGVDLQVARERGDHLCTVTAEGVPGLVTVVSQREVEGQGRGSTNPDFGVTWSMT